MKRTLQVLLIALMSVSAVSGAEAKKAKGETNKKLVPAASADADQTADSKKAPSATSAASIPHIPLIPMIQALGDNDKYDPDLPQHLQGRIDKAEYLRLRDEYIGILRGIDPDPSLPFDIARRNVAIQTMEHQVPTRPGNVPFPGWMPIGPSPVPNGQTQQFPTVAPVSGRATCTVVDPTNSNKVYLGTAQGGVWRSLDGGATWTPIFDAAQSLAIGALALAPSNPTILYVGTGEPNNSADSFFGVGVYRIDNADASAGLVGPINPVITTGSGAGAITTNCFTGRSITRILVNPTDAANIFVSTATGVAGAAGNALTNSVPPLGLRGVYRSTNATSAAASVTFQKLIVNTDGSLDSGPATGNTSIFDMAFEPGNANNLLVSTSGAATGGVIMRSTNALAATPTFTQVLFPGFNGLVMHLAINKVGAVVTAYVASNEPSSVAACSSTGQAGRVRKSVDGGATWGAPLVAAEGYCGGQCSYDNPVAVDPNDANIVYLGGNARGSCSDVLKRSADGGTTFTRDDNGLHADSHGLFIDPLTVPSTVWFNNDGGVWKRQDAPAGTAWLNQNTSGLNTIQFVSLAVHPTDQFLTIGGTQDNGTEAMQTSYGNWVSAESGDGGFALIDQSSTNTTNVTMYHTFFNGTNNFIGFDRTNLGTCLPPPNGNKDSWEFRGGGFANDATLSCDGTAFTVANGINVADTVLFYAPMALGPGTPNTLYFGTNKLYRSTDRGDTMPAVSQVFVAGVAVSAIGIAPGNDNIRIVGLRNGKVFATTTGANPLLDTGFVAPTNATASATNKHVARAVIDPLNFDTAYVTLAYYTNPSTAGQIWRTTNLSSATPTWTSIGNTAAGLPNVPVNGFVADGGDPGFPGVTVLYAGTDIGVYVSTNGGVSWNPFGNPLLPRVAIFDLVMQPSFRILRAATHGRGAWQIGLPGSNCVPVPSTPTITPSGATTFCTGGNVTLTSSSATGNQWYDGVTLLPGQTNQNYIATTSGNYNVVVTALCPSAPSASTAVTVNPLPATPTILGTLTFCAPGNTTLTSSSPSGNQWYLGGNPIGGETNQTYQATAAGSYTVQVTDGNGCVSSMSAPAVVTTNPTPATPTITPGGATTFCAGGSVTLTSSSATGNQWYDGATLLAGETNQTYVATTSGSYNVIVTASGCPSAASANTPVTVNPTPGAPTISGTLVFCTGGNTTLSSDYSNGNQWYLGGNPITGATNQTYLATAAGSYTVTFTDGNGCTSAQSAAAVVVVNSPPPIPTIAGTTNGTGTQDQACPEQPLTLTATSSGATSFQWYQDNNTLNGETASTYQATDVGTYYVTATASGCTTVQSVGYVVHNPRPHDAFLVAAGATTFCAGGSVQLQSNSATGIQWYRDTGSGPVAIAGAGSQNYVATVSGTYTVILNALGCHSGVSNSLVVTVNPLPATPTATPGGATTFCAGGSVTLTSSAASGNQWRLNGNPIGGATNTTYVVTAGGSYTVTTSDVNSCTSAASAAVVVTVNPIPATPTITPGGPTSFCPGGSVTLSSSSASGNQWFLNGNPIGGATGQTYPATASGSYTVTVTTSGCTGSSSAATVVTVNPNPNATITAPASVVKNSTGNIASVANAGAGATYAWSITGGTITAGTGTNSITFTAGGSPGTLTLNVTVTTSAGCSDAKSANVTVVLPTVTVTSVAPAFGTVTGGNSVTINGTNFASGAGVTFGGTAATSVVVVSSIKITAKTPAHAAGSVNVTVTNTDTSTGTLVSGFQYNAQVFDPNGDGSITSADIFFLVNYLFMNGPAPSGPAGILSGDANGDGVVSSADIFYLVNYLFLGGQKPNIPSALPSNPRGTAVGAEGPQLAGSITLGKPVLSAGRYVVPIIMTANPGSMTPQSMAFRAHFETDGTLGNVAVRSAGAAKNTGMPLFEISPRMENDLSYIVSYDPRNGGLNLGASHSAVVAEIEFAANNANITISLDPSVTMLSDQSGTTTATVANGKLKVGGTTIRNDASPKPRAPRSEVN